MPAAVLGAAVLEEGRQRAGGGVVEAVGEARWARHGLSRWGGALVGVAGESGESGVGTPGGGVAHRGRLLEGDADAAARRVFDGLPGLVAQLVVLQTVARRSQGAQMGAGARATQPSDRRTWPRGPCGARRRAASRGCGEMGKGVCVCVCERVWEGSVGQARNGFGK